MRVYVCVRDSREVEKLNGKEQRLPFLPRMCVYLCDT